MSYNKDKLQVQNWVKFYFKVKFDLDGQGPSSPKTIGTLTKVFYTLFPNLVILSWMGHELSQRQIKNWPRVKSETYHPSNSLSASTRQSTIQWWQSSEINHET